VGEGERATVVNPGNDRRGLDGPSCKRELGSRVEHDGGATAVQHCGQQGFGGRFRAAHPLVVAAADDPEVLQKGPPLT